MSGELRVVIDKHVRRWARAVRLDATGRFECPRHAGSLTLSPAACARLYRRGLDAVRSKDAAELVSVAPCVGCPIGATHAADGTTTCASDVAFMPGQGMRAEPIELRRRRAKLGGVASRESAHARKARRSAA